MAGHLILVTKLKGGAGATTTCRELAAAALAHGLTVALIDLDGQGGLGRWWNRRTKATNASRPTETLDLIQLTADRIPGGAAALRKKYDIVIIDSPPSVHDTIRSVAAVADLALIPSRPNVDDLDAVGPIVRLLHGTCDHAFVLTQIPPVRGSRDGAEAFERLAARAPVIGRTTFRTDYSRPPGHGSTGFEEASTAKDEIAALWANIVERLGIPLSNDRGRRHVRRG